MYWHDEKYKGRAITKETLIEIERDVKMEIDHYAQRLVWSSLTAYHDGNNIILVPHNEETAYYLMKIAGESKHRYEIYDYVCVLEHVLEAKVIPAKVVGIRSAQYSDKGNFFMYEIEYEKEEDPLSFCLRRDGPIYHVSESELVSVHEAIEIAKEWLKKKFDFLETHYFHDGQWIEIPIMEED